MKFFHIGDLHLGKRVYGFSMLEEQEEILKQILQNIDKEQPEVLLITGDVYDKGVPPVEAVHLLDWFLTALSERSIHTYLIAGNHDSAYRLDFGKKLMEKSNVFVCGQIGKRVPCYRETDAFGEIEIYLLPFFKPAQIRSLFSEACAEEIETYPDAAKRILQQIQVDTTKRNLLLAHQFVTWNGTAERSDSEALSVGGVEELDASLFFAFDYVALGHLHSPQRIGRDTVRYAGAPMPYAFSEIRQKKGITVVELREKGNCQIDFIPLQTTRKFREIKGPLEKLLQAAEETEDYIRCILTDTEMLLDPIGQLRSVYPNLMTLEWERQEHRAVPQQATDTLTEALEPQALFAAFFEKQQQKPLSEIQQGLLQKIWEALEKEQEEAGR